MPGRTTDDRTALGALVLGHERGQAKGAQVPDEVTCVVGPVSVRGHRPCYAAFKHRHGGVLLSVAVRLGQFDIDDQAVMVLAGNMAEIAGPPPLR